MLKKVIGKLARCRKGVALPMLAAAIIPTIAAIGGAIDIGRIYIVKSQMQAGVDAAALAAANAFDNKSETDDNGAYRQAVFYYLDNFPNTYMGTGSASDTTPYGGTATMLKPTFSQTDGISRTVVNATGDVPMTFMRVFGMDSFRVSATATAEFQPHPLEVMVVLDNTGSMNESVGGKTKMASLKLAMKSFLNAVFQGSTDRPDLALGIINYTITTNIGAILKKYSVSIEDVDGFTDRAWPLDPMGWKGCVANDETINNMSTSTTTREVNAYDIWSTVPGKAPLRPDPSSPRDMRPVRPFNYPPTYQAASWTADKTVPTSDYYKTRTNSEAGGPNLYMGDLLSASTLANKPIYKRYLYRLYKGLNNGAANMSDDVIVAADGSSYYDTTATGAYNDATGVGTDFYVRVDRVPNAAEFKLAAAYQITKYNVAGPTPNWQCPEAGLEVAYGRPKSTYDSFIDKDVWPVAPANGTMHHIGFLWGWRLLARYDVFTRTPPAGSAAPRRAIVFMTDGMTAFGVPSNMEGRVFAAYGSPIEKTISTATTASGYLNGVRTRFTKACAIANSQPMADSGETPMIFTVAINQGSDIDADGQTRLRNCGTSGYWLTTSPTELNNAFTQIARTLTDVHLTQ